MKVTFEPAARDELDQIFNWIVKDNPRAAAAMINRIEAKVMQLAHPEFVKYRPSGPSRRDARACRVALYHRLQDSREP
jgi:plasmid stabilization system protein ParE